MSDVTLGGGMAKMRCDQCSAAVINGVFCHEFGCSNTNARYDALTREWIKQRKCCECGMLVNVDDPCCSADYEPLEEFAARMRS